VSLLQQEGGAHAGLGQDLLAPPLRVVGHLPAVGLGVGHAAFRGLLRIGQDAHGLHRGTRRRCSRWGQRAARATGSAGTPERAAAVVAAAVPPAAVGTSVPAGIAVATLPVAVGVTARMGASVPAGARRAVSAVVTVAVPDATIDSR